MNAKLRVNLGEQMDMVRYDIQCRNPCFPFLAYLPNDRFQADRDISNEHLAAVLGTPDDVIMARIEHVPIRVIDLLFHTNIIEQ